jgi:hypothetical protein
VRPGASRYALLVAAVAVSARAEVGLALDGCDPLSEGALREHLTLELRTLGLERATSSLQLRCDGALVTVELTQSSGEPYPVKVRVELGETARGERERLVALAVTELISQAERPPRAARETVVRPPLERIPPPAPAARPAPERAVELFVAASGGVAGSEQTRVWGGALGARLGFERWALLLDTRFEGGDQSLVLANVRWSSLSGFLGATVAARSRYHELSAGLGVRAGWLSLAGRAEPPHLGSSMTAPWAGVALPVRAALLAGSRARPFVGLEGGYVLLPVSGLVDDGTVLLSQRGLWLTASVGVGVCL